MAAGVELGIGIMESAPGDLKVRIPVASGVLGVLLAALIFGGVLPGWRLLGQNVWSYGVGFLLGLALAAIIKRSSRPG